MNKFRQLWSNLRSSFWFMPSLIVVFSTALAVALIEADSAASDRWLAQWPRLFGAGAEGARGMMSTIAGSMMTVVGVTFAELAEHTLESVHDRVRIDMRLASAREALETSRCH